MFKNLKLSAKLIGGFTIVAMVVLIVGFVGWQGTDTLGSLVKTIGLTQLPGVQNLLTINEAQTAIDAAENTLLAADIDSTGRKAAQQRIDEAKKKADEAWKIYESLPMTNEEELTWKEFVPAWEAWWSDHTEFMKMAEQYQAGIDAGKAKDSDEMKTLYATMSRFALVEMTANYTKAENLLTKAVEINESGASQAVKDSLSAASSAQFMAVVGMAVGFIIALSFGIFLSRSITKPIQKVINALTEAGEQVSSASGQVAASSQQMAEGASEQASSLEEISSSLEELTSMTKQNAENAKQANAIAGESRKSAEKGNQAMSRMSEAISRIKNSSDETAKIVKTIDEIAFQTNLLALNAAVEAARAGEAGKGFAVVAEEVRNLAQRSAEAAKNTASLIEGSQTNADNGVEVAHEVAKLLEEMVVGSEKVSGLVAEVSAASDEQAQGIDQINIAVAEMDKVTQSNAANAEESASASEELSGQAREMNSTVEVLAAIVGGKKANGNGKELLARHLAIGTRSTSVTAEDHQLQDKVHKMLHKDGNGKHPVHAYIKQLKKPAAKEQKVVKPDQVIPLADEELREF
jgi:methyl-accepting chemotaxis protein